MNFTKDFHDYLNTVKNSFHTKQFTLKTQKSSIMDKSINILNKITESEKSIKKINESKY